MNTAFLIVTLSIVSGPFASLAHAKDAEPVVFVGSYEKVESSTGEHCYGYSVDIWKHDNQLFGLFHYHTGLCGDPPCGVVEVIRYDANKNNLKFNVTTRLSKFKFSGTLTREVLTGSLQESLGGNASWKTDIVKLPRKGTRRDDEFYEKIHSLSQWHERYDSYGRCMGVREYMKLSK